MSLKDDFRKHAKEVLPLAAKGKLILTKELVNKIHLTHHFTKANVEWSGILKYKVLEGSIENPENLVIEASDFLLMDIHSSTYTEYDFADGDDILGNYIMECGLTGYKYGHIHSHHGMNCFFSGTDMSELHDNAPNHNYYLSLIVNNKYEADSNWCAKIAYVTEEEIIGTKKVKSSLQIIKSYFGSSGKTSVESTEEKEEDVPVNTKKEFLNTIDLTISEERSEAYSIDLARLVEIKSKPRPASTITTGYGYGGGYTATAKHYPGTNSIVSKSYSPSGFLQKDKKKSTQKEFDFEDREGAFSGFEDWEDYHTPDISKPHSAVWTPKSYDKKLTFAEITRLQKLTDPIIKIRPFIYKFLKENLSHKYEKCGSFSELATVKLNDTELDRLQTALTSKFHAEFLRFFGLQKNEEYEQHLIAIAILIQLGKAQFDVNVIEAFHEESMLYTDIDYFNDLEELSHILKTPFEDMPWTYL